MQNISSILTEYFGRSIRELELLAPTNGMPIQRTPYGPVSIDQVLNLLKSIEENATWTWIPNDLEKFQRE